MDRISCGKFECLKEGTNFCGRSEGDAHQICVCNDGWTGDECATQSSMDRISCGKFQCLKEGTNFCGRSEGDGHQMCVCNDGWTGDECATQTCLGITPFGVPCNNQGRCLGNVCKCNPNWYGPKCDIYCNDSTTCNKKGYCGGSKRHKNVPEEKIGKCICTKPWTGENCQEKLPSPPDACVKTKMNCGTGGGKIGKIDASYDFEYLNGTPFKGISTINWDNDPPTATCKCNCRQGYYDVVENPQKKGDELIWEWGAPHPFDPSKKAPEYGNTNFGISTMLKDDGTCYPCPPGYYVNTLTDGKFAGKTICSECKCPDTQNDTGTLPQYFGRATDNSSVAKTEVCKGDGTNVLGDEPSKYRCQPEILWCDSNCYIKKSDSTCSLYNRDCPSGYSLIGKAGSNDNCIPPWSIKMCSYNHID